MPGAVVVYILSHQRPAQFIHHPPPEGYPLHKPFCSIGGCALSAPPALSTLTALSGGPHFVNLMLVVGGSGGPDFVKHNHIKKLHLRFASPPGSLLRLNAMHVEMVTKLLRNCCESVAKYLQKIETLTSMLSNCSEIASETSPKFLTTS